MTSTPSAILLRTVTRFFRVAVWVGAWLGACGLVPPAFSGEPPVPASLRAVVRAAGGVAVEWERAPGPVPVLGWHVERALPGGETLRLTETRVEAGLFDAPATVYRFQDASATVRIGDSVAYRLVAIDAELREWPSDLFSVVVEAESSRRAPSATAGRKETVFAKDAGPSTVGTRVRIAVTNDGLFWLSAAKIAGVLTGYSEAQVAQAIAQNQFALSCGGEPVAWRAQADGAGMFFFGQAVRDTYDRRGIYWLDPGPGLAMSNRDGRTAQVADDPWFWDTVRAEDDPFFVPYMPGGIDDDYWVWTGRSVSSPTTIWSWSNSVALADAHPGVKTGTVTAYLASGYDSTPTQDNHTRLLAGGVPVSDRQWPGDERLIQSGTATNLGGSAVTVAVEVRREADVTTTTVMIDALEVRYARRMQARNDQLLFQPEAGTNLVTVRGFSSSAIRVFDVMEPKRPVEIVATLAQEGAADWRASWAIDPAGGHRFLAVAGGWGVARIDGTVDAGWRGAKTGAPHVVIASQALAGEAAVLVAHRKRQGLDSILVPVEELFDAFSFGRRDPRAITLFLAHARANWTVPPAYVCLAGDGHLDFHEVYGQASTRPNHVPPFQDRIPYDSSPSGTMMTLGVDNPSADVDGDGVPDMAIGRLPAQTPAALAAMIARLVAFEASDAWKSQVLLVSDKDAVNAFAAARERLAEHVPSSLTVLREGMGTSTPVETMRTNFIRALNAGPLLAAYYGHANNVGISSPYFFEHSYVRSYMSLLTNSAQAPLLLGGTCMLNNFSQPHPDNRCLGKGFLDTAPGGAVAVWASASEASLSMSEDTTQIIFDGLFDSHGGLLGDLLRPALALQAGGASPWTVRSSVLLGDPGMQIRTASFRPLAIQPAAINLPFNETQGRQISVEALGAWTAVANASWIQITAGASGSGNGTVTYRVDANAGAARSGTITVSGGGITRIFSVNQFPKSATPGVSAEGDVDGDGSADFSVFHPATGNWHVLFNTGAGWVLPWGWSATLPVPADYNGDGLLDFAVYHPATGNWHIQESGTGRSRTVQFGWSATVPLPGDYDGDGKADLAVFHPAAGRWYFLCTTAGRYTAQWGWSTTVPVPADYDGDGATDIAVYHPASGLWQILKSSTGGAIQKQWGWSTALPVPADYNGDGAADVAVFHRATGKWYISFSGGGSRIKAFGWSTTIPVAADYDGDGAADLAVYHPTTGTWRVLKSTTGGTLVKNWGWSTAKPTLLYPLIHSWFNLP